MQRTRATGRRASLGSRAIHEASPCVRALASAELVLPNSVLPRHAIVNGYAAPTLRSTLGKLFALVEDPPGGVDSPVRAFKSVGGTPLFIARGARRPHRGRRRQPVHRLRDVVGTADPRPRAEGTAEGAGAAAARGTSFGAPTELETRAGAARRDADAVDGARALRQLRHRSGDERACGSRAPRPSATGSSSSKAAITATPTRSSCRPGSGAMTLGVPTSPGRPGRGGRRHAARPLQRSRRRSRRCSTRASRTDRRASSSSRSPATWASCRRRDGFLPGLRDALRPPAASLLIFDEVISGFPRRGRRRAAALRRPAGPHLPRQDHRRRPAGRRVRRPRRLMELVAPAGRSIRRERCREIRSR